MILRFDYNLQQCRDVNGTTGSFGIKDIFRALILSSLLIKMSVPLNNNIYTTMSHCVGHQVENDKGSEGIFDEETTYCTIVQIIYYFG